MGSIMVAGSVGPASRFGPGAPSRERCPACTATTAVRHTKTTKTTQTMEKQPTHPKQHAVNTRQSALTFFFG